MKKLILYWILFFIGINFLYAYAFTYQRSDSVFANLSTQITIVTTYPVKLANSLFGIKITGVLIIVNFILFALLFALIVIKAPSYLKKAGVFNLAKRNNHNNFLD